MRLTSLIRQLALAGLASAALAMPQSGALSQEKSVYEMDIKFPGTSGELWEDTRSKLRGKKIAYVPLTTGYPLFDSWTYVIKKEAAAYGLDLTVQDANWNPDVMSQAIAAAITNKVDLIIAHNLDVKLLAKQLKEAQEAGIYVVQVSMVSNYKTDAFVGADYLGLGATIARDVVKECSPANGKSGKIAIVQGATTAAATFDQYNGAKTIFSQHPEIEIVSDQSTGPLWSSDTAKQIVSSVLVQNPDLCAVYGFWDLMDMGTAAAIQEAGKQGQVKLFTSGGGSQQMCDLVEGGQYSQYYIYHSLRQGHDIMNTVKTLLLTQPPVGSSKFAIYTPIDVVTKETLKPWSCSPEEMVTQKK